MKIIPVILVLAALAGCSRPAENTGAMHHYPLTGKIVALDAKSQTAMIDAAAIPNFMEAMTMEYPIKSKAEFRTLHVGDRIRATVNVADEGGYDVTGIQIENSGK